MFGWGFAKQCLLAMKGCWGGNGINGVLRGVVRQSLPLPDWDACLCRRLISRLPSPLRSGSPIYHKHLSISSDHQSSLFLIAVENLFSFFHILYSGGE